MVSDNVHVQMGRRLVAGSNGVYWRSTQDRGRLRRERPWRDIRHDAVPNDGGLRRRWELLMKDEEDLREEPRIERKVACRRPGPASVSVRSRCLFGGLRRNPKQSAGEWEPKTRNYPAPLRIRFRPDCPPPPGFLGCRLRQAGKQEAFIIRGTAEFGFVSRAAQAISENCHARPRTNSSIIAIRRCHSTFRKRSPLLDRISDG